MFFVKILDKLRRIRESYYKLYLTKALGAKIGRGTKFSFHTYIDIRSGSLLIGENCTIEPNVRIKTGKNKISKIQIDDHVFIGYGTVIDANSFIHIKKNSMVAPYCFITDSDHRNQKKYVSIAAQIGIIEDTIIGENVWIGSHSQILRGVKLGDNSIVGANSTVLKGNYPPEVLLVGSPTKIKKRIFDI